MQGILYEEGIWPFILVSLLIGGWTAWMAGKGVAESWGKLFPQVSAYTLLLGLGVRFLHHALYGGTMFSLHYYLVDTIVVGIFMVIGFRMMRTTQMTTKYYWLYEKAGPFAWKEKRGAAVDGQKSI
jgi:hypothetical protein